MKKILIIPLVLAGIILSSQFFGGCYTETIDDLSTFKFRMPIFFRSTHFDKASPDTSRDFINLLEYKEYRDNKDRIMKAVIKEFNYRLRHVKITGDTIPYYMKNFSADSIAKWDAERDSMSQKEHYYEPGEEGEDTLGFEYIRFYLRFAELRPGYTDRSDLDSAHWRFDQVDTTNYLLGEYRDVNVKGYFRKSNHIIKVDSDIAAIISEAVRNRPAFWIITEYSKAYGQTEPKRKFPFIAADYDMFIKFQVEL